MIDPIQPQTAAVTPVSSSDTTRSASDSPASAPAGALSGVQKAPTPSTGEASQKAAQASGSSGATDSQSSPDAAQPLRLLIEHDKATNHYVYKLYDSSGRIVREIPQESLADAQKQAIGSPGAVIDTKV